MAWQNKVAVWSVPGVSGTGLLSKQCFEDEERYLKDIHMRFAAAHGQSLFMAAAVMGTTCAS